MASTSSYSSSIPAKRPRNGSISPVDEPLPPAPSPATSQRFKNSIVLAPMVRSGTMPTRLLALKYGASLVWGPEIVDKAMLHAKRTVNEKTGVVSFEGITSSIWSCHPAERPYLIYQIGSSSPSLAVAAALLVSRDVSGVDLNCGCPKPFSTSGGMGAALLDTPDILCDILTSLRKALPPHISVSCKIRILPDPQKTLVLVERIVKTGISCLTVHCRTRNMRKGERAIPERLRAIVDFVRAMRDENGNPYDVAIIANGDVEGWSDIQRVKDITGADGFMVATKAEENPSCFSADMIDGEELIARYLRIANYTSNTFGNTKHCISTFKSAPGVVNQKAALKALRAIIAQAKDYSGFASFMRERHETEVTNGTRFDDFDEESWGGDKEIDEIVANIKSRPPPAWWVGVEEWERANPLQSQTMDIDIREEGIKKLLEQDREERPRKKSKVDQADVKATASAATGAATETPLHTTNPEIAALATPGPLFMSYVPPMVVGRNERSPSPERAVSKATLIRTSSIIDEVTHQPLLSTLSSVVETCVKLRSKGHKVVLVSSGAIGVGLRRMKVANKPKALSGRQALAAIGQGRLIALWDSLFGHLNQPIAQILLTRGDISDRSRYLNAVNTFSELFNMGVIPIVNENDTVSVSEIRFGDNDTLSAITATMVHADYLFLLTDVDSLYTSNPRKDPDALPIETVDSVAEIRKTVSTATLGSKLGTGGMETKLIAAEIATAAGVATVVTSSKVPENVFKIIEYNTLLAKNAARPTVPHTLSNSSSVTPSSALASVDMEPEDTISNSMPLVADSPAPDMVRPPHTLFKPSATPLRDAKSWTAYTLAPAGTVLIDSGAHRVLSKRDSGGRLLAVGVVDVSGVFASGQAVRIVVRKKLDRAVSSHSHDHPRSRPKSRAGQAEVLHGIELNDSNPGSPRTPGTPSLVPLSLSALSVSSLEPFSRTMSESSLGEVDATPHPGGVDVTPVAGVLSLPVETNVDNDTLLNRADVEGQEDALKDRESKPKETKVHYTVTMGREEEWIDVEVGRGLANYNSVEIAKVKGLKSSNIAQVLGYSDSEYLVENITIHLAP
ncbi:hypothetical protein FRC17_010271 [Serendipita sp. 399]|nr:hypothetical protein FRC17_010271 [Serendipita sp. 399]